MFNDFPEDNQNDDFLNEFRQKLAHQPTARIEEKQKEMQRSKSVFLGAATGIGLACAVGWFVLAPRYSSNLESEIPVVKRPQTAVKIKPTEPGGMEISNQDKSIYDIIDNSETKEKTVENLLPPPEEPKLPEVVAETVSETEQVVAEAPATEAQEAEAPVVANETVVQESVEAKTIQNEVAQDKTVSIAEASEQLQKGPQKRSPLFVDPRVAYQERLKEKQAEENAQFELAKAEAAKQAKERVTGVAEKTSAAVASVETPVQAPKEEVAKAQAAPASTSTVAPAGSWQIQLMSSKNKSAVEKSWPGLVKKYPVLANLPYEIETADIDFGSTYYRLKTGAFTNKADADNVCNKIKASGGSCLVKKK